MIIMKNTQKKEIKDKDNNKKNETEDTTRRKYDCKAYDIETANMTAKKLKMLRQEKYKTFLNFQIACDSMKTPASYYSMINFEQEVSDYEKDTRQNVRGMKLSTFYGLCKLYNVSPNYLLIENASRHSEDTADKIKADWNIDDNLLDFFKRTARHSNIFLGKMTEMDFLSFILTNYFADFETLVVDYVHALKNKNDFIDKYVDKSTDLFKDEYIVDEEFTLPVQYELSEQPNPAKRYEYAEQCEEVAQYINESELIEEYRKLSHKVDYTKYELFRYIEEFLNKLYEKTFIKCQKSNNS